MAQSTPKKMNVVQLTFMVTVNMMGSGIIMLPTNMAKVGAISLLSWVVTAVGSMAMAWGFAQAGIYNQRPGGMAAYAEDAYGKAGYFQTFFLYFVSLAIANVAVGISAVGYLAGFFPWLTSSPGATCAGVIAILWLTTVANFGGPSVTGRLGAVTVWGVILPVGFMSFFGWFWFKGETFAAAWNPNGLSLGAGIGSSIALTLWAFLGFETASQNASAVENPKRDVPIACLFGTLGAAVIYVLSTTAIQGIVPNAELQASTGSFGTAFTHMFNPTIGSIVMVLAVTACLGSLLGWQFTLASVAKDAAGTQMFPSVFGKVTAAGAPITGMIIMGVVQTLMALMTISPDLASQFGALVNLAVVTNLVPYIVALSAVTVILQAAGVAGGSYTRTIVITVIGILYSIYALYAAGPSAVMGGILVMGLGWLIWAFMAPRFAGAIKAGARAPAGAAVTAASAVLGVGCVIALLLAPTRDANAATLDHVRETGKLVLGYRADARPFSYRNESGAAAGYSVAICERIAKTLAADAGNASLPVEWVVLSGQGLGSVKTGAVDLLCSAEPATLSNRHNASFSIPIFPGGIAGVVRANGPARLTAVLEERPPPYQPLWRGTVPSVLEQRTFGAVARTPGLDWLQERAATLKVPGAKVVSVDGYDIGIERVADGETDVLFGDRAQLLDAVVRTKKTNDVRVLTRHFTFEPRALAFARNDDDFRLAVDRALTHLYLSPEFGELYTSTFGKPDADTVAFFRATGVPEK